MDGIQDLRHARTPTSRQPWRMRLLLRALTKLRIGELKVVAPDGSAYQFKGIERGPAATVVVRNLAVISRLLFSGDLGFAEAYMDGQWDTPDLMALLELGQLNAQALGDVEQPTLLRRLMTNFSHACRRNTRRGAKRNIRHHYDLGNDFYKLWLDESLTYSSALFTYPEQSLAQAQENKYRRLVDLLQLQAGQHLLEVGCGWGGFAIYAAQQTGCRVTGITLSPSQLKEAQARAAAAGVADRVHLELRDYRDLDGQYDRIVSVEMFEAVGENYWGTYFRTIGDRLRQGGRAAIQVITINDAVFPHYRNTTDFIQRYIFPGGLLPSPARWEEEVQRAGLHTKSREFHGKDYARTLELWDRRVRQAEPAISNLGFDDRFLRMWHYYLAYCHAGFVSGQVDVMQTVLTKNP